MTKRTIIFASMLFIASAVNAQAANKRSQTTAARQPVPLAATAEVNTVSATANTVTTNASVNAIGINVTAAPVQERPVNDVKKPVERKNVSGSKVEKQK